MKMFRVIAGVLFIAIQISYLTAAPQQKSLQDIYRTGSVRFVKLQEITVDTYADFTDSKTFLGFAFMGENLYIVDSGAHNVKIVHRNGKFKKAVGGKGRGPGNLYVPSRIAVVNSSLAVWELGNRRFSLFTPEGKFIRHVTPFDGQQMRNIKPLDNGNLVCEIHKSDWVTNKLKTHRKLVLLSKDLEIIRIIYQKKVDDGKHIKEKRRTIPSFFAPDVYWDVLPGNKIVYGFSAKYQLFVHDTVNDKTTRFSHRYTPIEVTEEDKKDKLEGMFVNGRPTGADKSMWKYFDFPDYKPAFDRIVADGDGNILVICNPDRQHTHTNAFDAFASKGRFIKRVKIVAPVEGVDMPLVKPEKGNVLWVLGQNDDDYPSLTRYDIKPLKRD